MPDKQLKRTQRHKQQYFKILGDLSLMKMNEIKQASNMPWFQRADC